MFRQCRCLSIAVFAANISIYTIINYLAVQEERGPRKTKSPRRKPSSQRKLTQMLNAHLMDRQKVPKPITPNHEILVKILVSCIRTVRANEQFRQLSWSQQNVILRHAWCECFVLRASHWSINIGEIVKTYNVFLFS